MRQVADASPTPGPADDPLALAVELGASLEPREVIARVLETALRLLRVDRATLSRLAGEEVIIEATAGDPTGIVWVGRRYPRSTLDAQPPVMRAIEERQPIFAGRLNVGGALPEFQGALALVRHSCSIPLLHAGDLIGLLVLSRYIDEPFTGDDRELALKLGAAAGLALRNAYQLAASKAEAARLSAMVAASEDIAAQVEVADVVSRLLRHIAAVSGADEASLAIPDGDELIIEASTAGRPRGERYPIAAESRAAIASNRPIQVSYAEYAERYPEAAGAIDQYRRFLVVPLSVAGQSFGLCTLGRHEDEAFTPEEIAAAQSFAALASLLVRNIRAREQAEAADAARVEFVNIAVHELRAPLGVIRGYLDMVVGGQLDLTDPRTADFLRTVSEKATELSDKVDEMQLAARVEFGALKAEEESFDVNAEVAAAVDRAQPRAEIRQGKVGSAATSPAIGLGDRRFVGLILDNLINNALTYVDAPPDVVITSEVGADAVVVRVTDKGPGVRADVVDRIFERFVRGDTTRGGMGLGLYVSRQLAEQMGGALDLEATGPTGSVFRLRLRRSAA